MNSFTTFGILRVSRPLKFAKSSRLSLTVRNSGKYSNCGQNPKLFIAFNLSFSMLYPFMNADPLVACFSPVNILENLKYYFFS